MNDVSYEQLLDRLAGERAPTGAVTDLVLAAADGAEALDAHLAGGAAPQPRATSDGAASPEPARVYLDQIQVQNFRGIGPAAKLPLPVGNGLTLVVGRNGSGKSSFAEGLELLLTGTNQRWEGRTKVWQEGWRNLHGDGAAEILARFRVDGEAKPLELRRRWAADAKLAGGDPMTVQGPRDSWEALGWDEALAQFRPLLSYNELGTMFSERAAALYEALSGVLGLQDFDELAATVREARLAREQSSKRERDERTQLNRTLETVEDPRAAQILGLLAKRPADVAAIEQLVAGDDDDASTTGLQPLATLALPEADGLAPAIHALAVARDEVARLEATDVDRIDALARVLEQAVSYHGTHDAEDQICPVCGTADVLDAGWSIRTQAHVEELRRQSAALREARAAVLPARRAIGELFPANLPAIARTAAEQGTDVGGLPAAWDRWAEVLRGADDAVAEEALPVAQALLREAEAARAAAAAELERRDTAWRPTREAVLAWCASCHRAALDKDLVARLKDAEAWLKDATAELRRERLQPVVEAAQANWAELRHESNVALGEVELRKEGTRRYAAFDVTVDGSSSSAFGVMSQGELAALAVSVFLPRASLPASPFGFMVIDDPVQSMDPAKVDGLARVLARAAETRQVIVFTHDARLPEAVERLDIDARIMHVKRRAQSKVEIVAHRPPSDRYVGEALAFSKTENVSDEVRARVVPGLCRSAIEAACAARIRQRLIGEGVSHAAVEERLMEKTSLNTWLADAFELTVAQGNEIAGRVRQLAGDDGVATVRLVNKGAHQLIAADGQQLAESTKRLVRAIEPA